MDLISVSKSLFSKSTKKVSSLWFESPSYQKSPLWEKASPELRNHIINIREDGWTLIKQAVPHSDCDNLVKDFTGFCQKANEAPKYADEFGYHSRLCNFHLKSQACLEVIFNKNVMGVLDGFFGAKTSIYSSLTFEKSTQQALHRDTPFFLTAPKDLYFGVWTALEDVDPEAGPLFFYEGGHRITSLNETAIGERHKNASGDPLALMFDEYKQLLQKACDEGGFQRREALLKKGDVLIWHPSLPHGGSQIMNPRKTRKSVVIHVTPENTPVYGIDKFFDPAQIPQKHSPRSYRTFSGRKYVDHLKPHFDYNY
jgi:ectoine hydroxylase-related dioxygenase (phytanoyl-CoA dioxygenase family)